MILALALSCAYVGDSIAVGLEWSDTRCESHARVGASSREIARNYLEQFGRDYTIISMGSNNPTDVRLRSDAQTLRSRIISNQVVWILPYHRRAAAVIREVAEGNNDRYIDLINFRSNDGIHPQYGAVFRRIRFILNEE